MRQQQLLPDNIVRRMRPEDRKALGVETFEEANRRGEVKREADLQRACESLLMRRGIPFLHLSHRAREKAGWPDLTFVIDGVPYAVELKSATGKLTVEQEQMLKAMDRHGWRTHVVRDYKTFVEIITSLKDKKEA